ncbi:hypothetical protein phiNJ2_0036 [Streptococcus phage phiNJ2]|uniref:hypothetical protein n=1 Tax=Streptococcus phage phiNJ2 TaxID=1239381 RepID=UPI00028A5C37|nr:hypothetical protein [Streptococcus suis]YP_006990355.1 hypothetical protein phiNJ2_0036 [Streptococcus phage phiNJ2]AFU88696.1 hypothetical protein phiNJ2_0036 [Streptococcus phage phiNJ2]QZS61083.1 hypothetical protein K6972_00850 [Streptococcus suis]
MTKETKNTVSAETIVENLKEFADKIHSVSKETMLYCFLTNDIDKFKSANVMHNISHDLMDILDGKSAEEIFNDDAENENDEDVDTIIGTIAVNLKTGDANGIEDIKDPELKEQIAKAISKIADKLGGK